MEGLAFFAVLCNYPGAANPLLDISASWQKTLGGIILKIKILKSVFLLSLCAGTWPSPFVKLICEFIKEIKCFLTTIKSSQEL
jgi:hypothetical protein